MAARFQKQRRIIDLETMEEIDITGKVKQFCEIHGIDQGSMYRLNSGVLKHIYGRFIDIKSLEDCFELIDIDSGEIYKCITSATIFFRLGFEYNDNEAKYVYELKSGRQYRASICGRVFQIGGSCKKRKVRPMKNKSNLISEEIKLSEDRKSIKHKGYCIVNSVLKRRRTIKDAKVEQLVGCNSKSLLKYIRSKFTPGMTMENYGEWEIDHIIPCRFFDLKKENELKMAFHYTNMQPIWATTKIAASKGFDNYKGNRNKNSRNTMEEYYTTHLITSTFPEIQIEDARFCSSFLFENGYRKLLPQRK